MYAKLSTVLGMQGRRTNSSFPQGGSGHPPEYADPADLPGIPWVRSVLSGCDIMRNPKYNKGKCHFRHASFTCHVCQRAQHMWEVTSRSGTEAGLALKCG